MTVLPVAGAADGGDGREGGWEGRSEGLTVIGKTIPTHDPWHDQGQTLKTA